jgi:hypothetical protein
MLVYENEDAKIFHLANLLAKHHTRAVEWTRVSRQQGHLHNMYVLNNRAG